MRLAVLWIGKTRLAGIAPLTEEYSKRLARYCEFEGREVRPSGKGRGATAEDAILARSRDGFLVILDPAGKQWSSAELARFLGRERDRGRRSMTFCVGGAEGFTTGFREKAGLLLSLSPLTMPHELARVVLLEQLYRAFTTLAGHPYPR